MGTDEIIRNRATVSKLLVFETITVMLTGFIVFIFSSLEFTYSVILGGFAYILPNAIFAKLSLKISATNSSNILIWFYVGEAMKIVTTIVFFALSFLLVEMLNFGLMILTYGLVLLVNLIGLSIFVNNK
jgi:F0F1-type ATP synthase assembly protein I|tara:strand:- start:1008 stop:1394 length:387 start_codon:yes stop_codon:yes gene_type:complete